MKRNPVAGLKVPAEFDVKLRLVGKSLVISIPGPAYRGLRWNEGDVLKLIVRDDKIEVRKETDS